MKSLSTVTAAIAFLGAVTSASAEQELFSILHIHADGDMYCQYNSNGSFSMYRNGVQIIVVNNASFYGQENADQIDGKPMEGYAVSHYPNLFERQDLDQEIWDDPKVNVSEAFQGSLAGHDVRLTLDTNSAVEETGEVSREGAHCRIEVTDYKSKQHTVTFMPLMAPTS